MVLVHVRFRLASRHWTLDYVANDGEVVQQLKELMLKSRGSVADMNSFELRKDGQRVSDSHLLWQDTTLDFKFLGAERGLKRASKDNAGAEAAKAVGANPDGMSLESALGLQEDLMAGYGRPAFQEQMDVLTEKFMDNERKFLAERQKLFLTVQKRVLPKWGFPGTAKGVFEMMRALSKAEFSLDPEFQKKGWFINKLLRILPPGAEAEPPRPVAPQPAPEPAPPKPHLTRDASLQMQRDLVNRLASAAFRGAVDEVARRSGINSAEVVETREHLSKQAFAEMQATHGQQAQDLSLLWDTWQSSTDEEIRAGHANIVELLAYGGAAAAPAKDEGESKIGGLQCFVGEWSGVNGPVCHIARAGGVLVLTAAGEAWSPARASVSDEQVITLVSPEPAKGYGGKLSGDILHWIDGDNWHRLVDMPVTVEWDPDDPKKYVTLQASAGATVRWVKDELRTSGPAERKWTEDLNLVSVDRPDAHLKDEQVVTPVLGKLRVVGHKAGGAVRGQELPDHAGASPISLQTPDPSKPDKPTAQSGTPGDRPATPRTSSQMFDFHELDDL